MSESPVDRPTDSRATSLTLIERARQNEPEAWRRLVHLYNPLVLYWCGRSGVRNADADDVVQEVFRAAATGLALFRKDRPGDTFRGWLRGITRNILLAQHRKAEAHQRAEGGTEAHERLHAVPAPPHDEPSDEDPPGELRRLYLRTLELVRNEFEARTWQAFWRTTVDAIPTAEAAAELGMSAASVRQARSRILRRLKEEVGDLAE